MNIKNISSNYNISHAKMPSQWINKLKKSLMLKSRKKNSWPNIVGVIEFSIFFFDDTGYYFLIIDFNDFFFVVFRTTYVVK